jgi:ubiquinone/menaquinone biosynthesis C-methylase UbiE
MKRIIFVTLLLSLFVSCAGHKKHGHKGGHHHRFDDAQKWAKVFEDPKRDKWQQPNKIFKQLKITKKMKIADIGSATGYFPVRLAKLVPQGRVWGIDVEPNLVRFLNKRVEKEGINNVFSTLGTFDDPLIPERVDYIFIVNTYHHINDRVHYLKNLKNYLKKNGKIVIIDFKKGDLPFGPKDHAKFHPEKVTKEFTQAGYKLIKNPKVLEFQYILVYQK